MVPEEADRGKRDISIEISARKRDGEFGVRDERRTDRPCGGGAKRAPGACGPVEGTGVGRWAWLGSVCSCSSGGSRWSARDTPATQRALSGDAHRTEGAKKVRHRPERKRGRSTATTPTPRESSGDKLWRCQCVCGLLSLASVRRVGGARVERSTVKEGREGRRGGYRYHRTSVR